MLKVFKYSVPVADEFSHLMPAGARLLTVQMQAGQGPQLWALVDPDAELVQRTFRMAGTGHAITTPPARLDYVASFQPHPELIFHVFEVRS